MDAAFQVLVAIFPNAPQKGSRFKVGVQGSRRRPKSLRLCPQSFASARECRASLGTVTGIGSVVVAKPRKVVAFGLALGLRVSKGPGRETSLLDWHWVFAPQTCQQSQAWRGSWLRNAELSLLDLRWVVASKKGSTDTGAGGVLVAKRRTVVASGLSLGRRIPKVSTKRGTGGVVVAKCRTVVTFGLGRKTQKKGEGREEREDRREERGEERGEGRVERRGETTEERREEGGEKREERREERGEERGERTEERREGRGQRREERAEKKEERRERREERGEKSQERRERREKRREDDPEPKSSDWFRALGVIIILGSWILSGL